MTTNPSTKKKDIDQLRREWEREAFPAFLFGIVCASLWWIGWDVVIVFLIFWLLGTLIIRQQQEPKP